MLEVLDRHFLSPKDSAFYDVNAKSTIELLANFHAKLNECVKEINDFMDLYKNSLDEFKAEDEKSKQEHMTAIRQEFQDFIDIINLKIIALESEYSVYDGELLRWKEEQETARETFESNMETVINDAKAYMTDNIVETTRTVAREELSNQNITVELVYNPETEDLSIAY